MHLFLDETLIAEKSGVTLRVNPPAVKELAFVADQPWERNGITCYANVLWDDLAREYRMYYVPVHLDCDPIFRLAMAHSDDGIHWEKPTLNAVEWNGSRENNIVIDGQREGCVFINPNAPPDRRYAYLSSTETTGIHLFQSPDGIHFTRGPQLNAHSNDSQLSSFYDDQRRKYVHFPRVWHLGGSDWKPPAKVRVPAHFKFPPAQPMARTVTRVETDHIDDPWPDEFLLAMARDDNDPPDMDLYTNAAQKYALAPNAYFAFPTPYYHYDAAARKYLNEPALSRGGVTNDGTLDTQLATSRDGITWTRHRAPLFSLQRQGDLDLKVVMAFPGLLYHKDRIDQYFAGYTFTHGDKPARRRLSGRALGGIFRASQRPDGFISADFDYTGGELLTHPLTVAGDRLLLNLNTSASGEARVAILDANQHEIPGFSLADCRIINGDYLAAEVRWHSTKLGSLDGRQVRLRFALRGAKLYSFHFAG